MTSIAKTKEATRPMTQRSDLDTATRFCPCGSQFTWSDDYDALTKWTEEHRAHTNGKLHEEAGDDWHRVYASKPKAAVRDL